MINAITAYCSVEEGTPYRHGLLAKGDAPTATEAAKLTLSVSDIALSQAILSIKTEK